MSFWRALLSVALLLTLPLAAGAQPRSLRVVSYNVHHCRGADDRIDIERIAKVILSMKPDLVALQEVDRNTRRSGGVDQAAELARLTKMEMAFGSNLKLQGGDYGNVILSRWKISESTNHRLPNHRDGEPRGILEARIQLNPRYQLTFCSTHFDHRKNPSERVASAKRINELLKPFGTEVILAGDLNAEPRSEPMKILSRQWRSAGQTVTPTIPVDKPKRQIDYVLLPRSSAWRSLSATTLHSTASDHRPLVALLKR